MNIGIIFNKIIGRNIKMKKIVVFNTWVGSLNTGDKIIMESCKKNIIYSLFDKYFYTELTTHLNLNVFNFKNLKNSKYSFVCGTNLLQPMSLFAIRNQWKIGILFLIYLIFNKIDNIILVGVGWGSYKYKKFSFIQKLMMRRLLSKKYIHSVRDEFTKEKLNEIGIYNVINTGCVTTWNLNEEHCNQIPIKKSKNVIFTLTDYNKSYIKDRELFEILEKNYEKIYFWPQGSGDLEYINKLLKDKNNYKIIAPNFEKYIEFLEKNDCDYVGTRLHGGIKALQLQKRSFIIGIDNRALEMKEIGLPVIKRDTIQELIKYIINDYEIKLNLPTENIEKWKKQFNQSEL